MNRSKICFILAFVVTLVSADLHAQKKKMPTKQKPKTSQPPTQKKQTPNQKKQVVTTPTVREKPAENQAGEPDKKVRDIVAFFEFMLNTLGSSSTSIRDKEVLVRESYSKVFRDQKVQVEDDLENRNVITNKDVVAYLKDVDFFFTDVKFEFTVDKIEGGGTESNGVFYKVTLHRNLQGKTIDGEEVNNTVQRFIEINDNPEEGLKIVSIYTKGFDEREALTSWWNDLSYEWRSIFKRKVGVSHDSVTLEEIREIIDIDSLDISGNFFIRSMEPLSQLTALSTLNISGTMVEDLSPIRNLTTLRELALANTNIKDLSALKYASGMTRLDLRNVPLANADVIQKMPLLQQLDISGTMISDLTLLAGLTELRRLNASKTRISSIGALSELRAITELDISSTAVTDLATVGKLTGLVTLNIDSTKVADFRPLATATSLKTLYANQTRVENIQPLKGLPALEKVYCDQTPIVAAVANAFMAERPGVLIIYDSKDLLAWWGTLGVSWKKILFGLGADPTKDDLARITNLDSVNLSGNAAIEKLDPLARLPKLKVIIANATAVIDLTPIKDHQELVLLDVSNTDVTDLSPLRRLRKLAEVRANNTRVQNIDPLSELKQLVKIEVDDSGIHDIHAREFLATKPACLLVYKTYHVQRWWQRLSDDWKKVFSQQLKKPDPSDRKSVV